MLLVGFAASVVRSMFDFGISISSLLTFLLIDIFR